LNSFLVQAAQIVHLLAGIVFPDADFFFDLVNFILQDLLLIHTLQHSHLRVSLDNPATADH
jgi:hypothetical protein